MFRERLDNATFYAKLDGMILSGMGRGSIARAMQIGETTVKNRKHALRKLGVLPYDRTQVTKTEANHADRNG